MISLEIILEIILEIDREFATFPEVAVKASLEEKVMNFAYILLTLPRLHKIHVGNLELRN